MLWKYQCIHTIYFCNTFMYIEWREESLDDNQDAVCTAGTKPFCPSAQSSCASLGPVELFTSTLTSSSHGVFQRWAYCNENPFYRNLAEFLMELSSCEAVFLNRLYISWGYELCFIFLYGLRIVPGSVFEWLANLLTILPFIIIIKLFLC